jgi:hypothetical protein
MDLTAYLTQRLRAIQGTHNFNPDVGAVQVRPASAIDYGAYREVLAIAEKLKLSLPSFYDPSGLNPEQREAKRKARPVAIYFGNLHNDPTDLLENWT